MDLEATIVERLQKLRQWQLEQQERLLKQQQMQREMLTQKQDCIYKALELSIQELDINGSALENSHIIGENPNSMVYVESQEAEHHNQSSNEQNIISEQESSQNELLEEIVNVDSNIKEQSQRKVMCDTKNNICLMLTPQKQQQIDKLLIDGVAPLPHDKILINRVSIDDVPVPSPKKDFHVLLEERLKDYENVPHEGLDTNVATKAKKPFLKKGEGLSRFRLNRESQPCKNRSRSRSVSFSANTRSDSKHCKTETRSNSAVRPSKSTQLTKNVHHTNSAQKQLSLKNIPLPKQKVRSKSESGTSGTYLKDSVNKCKNTPELSASDLHSATQKTELNTSDFQSRTQKEMEEVRIFELLEEKAENSSFCSTSSTVIAFLQQSTPFKLIKNGHNVAGELVSMKQASPLIKNLKDQSILKSNYARICATSNKSKDSPCDFTPFVNEEELKWSLAKENRIPTSVYKSIKALQEVSENNKIDANVKKHVSSLRNQAVHNQQNSMSNIENANDVDVSLHVRFSEYNEYKTIGLTDTSSISTDSSVLNNFSDEKLRNDSVTSDIYDTESMSFEVPLPPTIIKGKIESNNCKPKLELCCAQEELNYKMENLESMRQNNDFNYNENIHQYVYHNDESEFSDSTDQSPDEQQNTLLEHSQEDSLSHEIDNFQCIEKSKKCTENCEIQKMDTCINSPNGTNITEDKRNDEHPEINGTIFKSELLKSRLLELEQEINIFRRENAALSVQRQKLQEDHRSLRKEFTEKEKHFEENRKQIEDRLQEERKKLAREKAALENRMRDSQEKAQQSKLERHEIQNLKHEVEKLKDDIHTKESRWNAAQSRHKCQMRILKVENSKLKQEIERLQNLKKSNVRNKGKVGKSGTLSNTKAIHEINKQLTMQLKESKKTDDISSSDDSSHKLIEPKIKATSIVDTKNEEKNEYNCDSNKSAINEQFQKCHSSLINVAKKRNLYENLIREATVDLTEVQEQPNTSEYVRENKPDNEIKKVERRSSSVEDDSENLNKDTDVHFNHISPNNNVQLHVQNDYTHFIPPINAPCENHNQKLMSVSSDELPLGACIKSPPLSSQSSSNVDKQGIRQIQHPDGRIEYWYPNGNVKKMFPDQGLTKLIYYNGDVRETNKDGKVKYFYASTRTWHTTMPDGLEILEFADGQVEKRSQNGTVEISFPDGSIRILESDGSEKWTLPDGTVIVTFTNGEKIFTLPNGQREIHTKDHKRREYPDGTIKLMYPDGTQETRYSNGRTRLKDKDGNLLMDLCQ